MKLICTFDSLNGEINRKLDFRDEENVTTVMIASAIAMAYSVFMPDDKTECEIINNFIEDILKRNLNMDSLIHVVEKMCGFLVDDNIANNIIIEAGINDKDKNIKGRENYYFNTIGKAEGRHILVFILANMQMILEHEEELPADELFYHIRNIAAELKQNTTDNSPNNGPLN